MRILLILLILSLVGCSGKRVNYSDYSWKQSSETEYKRLDKYKFDSTKELSTKFLVIVEAKRGKEITRFRHVVIYNANQNLSFETYPVNQWIIFNKFNTDWKTFEYFDFQDHKKNESGRYSPNLLQKYFSLPVTTKELVPLLLRKIPETWIAENLEQANNSQSVYGLSKKGVTFEIDDKLNSFIKYDPSSLKSQLVGKYSSDKKLNLYLPKYKLDIKLSIEEVKN